MRKTHEQFLLDINELPFTVIGVYDTAKTKIPFRCKICGHTWTAAPSNILTGNGCPSCKGKKISDAKKGTNKIIQHSGDTLIVDVSTPLHPSATMLLNVEDTSLLSGKGRISVGKNGYCYRYTKLNKGLIHRAVMKVINPKIGIDHINGDPTDNRRINLRICTQSQNCMNSRPQSNNKSGHPGVRTRTSGRTWLAEIGIQNKTIGLGTFKKIEDAIIAREKAELKYFGEFRYTATRKGERPDEQHKRQDPVSN